MSESGLQQKLQFIKEYYQARNAATGSKYDSNANVTQKNLATLQCELGKKDIIEVRREIMRLYLTKLYSAPVSDQYFDDLKHHFIYQNDETTLYPYTYSAKEVVNVKYEGQSLLASMDQLYSLVDMEEVLLDEEKEVYAKFPQGLQILDRDGWTTVRRLIRKKRHRGLVRVKTAFGEDLVVTDNHPLIVSDDIESTVEAQYGAEQGCKQFKLDKPLEWNTHRTLDLAAICADRIMEQFDTHFTCHLKKCGRYYLSPNTIELTEELGYLIGFFIGDGNYVSGSDENTEITQKDRDVLVKLANIAIKYFNAACGIYHDAKSGKYTLYIYSLSLSTLLRRYFKIGCYAQNKTLPINILETNKDFAKGVIWGLVDSDGSAREGTITIRISSRAGINQLYWILKDLGYTAGCRMQESPVGFAGQISKGYTQNYTIWCVSATVRDESLLSPLSFKAKDVQINKHTLKYKDGWVNIVNVDPLRDGLFLNEVNEYIYDITTDSHSFICNNLWVHNCAAISIYPFLLDGLKPLGGSSAAPKHANSFIGGLINLIFMGASQFAGALAIPEFFGAFDYFLRKDYGQDYVDHWDEVIDSWGSRKSTLKDKIHDWFQQFVHSINQPAGARNYQSPFVNVAYFDRNYFENIFKDYIFPDGEEPCWETTKELQKLFMKWFNKERTHEVLTFPVETANLLAKDGEYADEETADFMAEMWSEGHSFFMYQSDSVDALASCCRLRNELQDNVFSYTLGAGGVKTGSKCVITLNLNRIVQDWYRNASAEERKEGVAPRIREMILRVHKYLNAWNEKLWDDFREGMLPMYTQGFIDLDKQYVTCGVNGFVEAGEFLAAQTDTKYNGLEISYTSEAYKALAEDILGTIKEENRKARTEHFMVNTECVPAENLAAKFYNWDKRDGYMVPEGRVLYNSYFYRVEDPTVDPVAKFYYQGKGFATECDGGVALHNNLSEHLTKEQYRKLMDVAVDAGCNYWTYNIPNTICNECGHIDKHMLDRCPKCGSTNLDYATRIIGYLKRISNFSAVRQAEAKMRHYGRLDQEDFDYEVAQDYCE